MTMPVGKIRDTERDNLQISEDVAIDDGAPIAVLLFTPDMADTSEHHHIELDREQAAALKQWLHEYLERTSS